MTDNLKYMQIFLLMIFSCMKIENKSRKKERKRDHITYY